MIDSRAVSRYAEALFGLADQAHQSDAIDRDFSTFLKLALAQPNLLKILSSSMIAQAEKEKFLDRILPQRFSKLLSQFLKVLIKKHRVKELPAIQGKFHALVEIAQGIREVEATSAAKLSPQNEEKLKKVLSQKLRSEIRLIAKVDPRLIGGLVVRFDGKEIDGSYKNQLDELKQRLMQ